MMIIPFFILMIDDDDDRAFMEKLYIEYHKLMYWTAFKVIWRRDGLDDIVNDACVSLICKISRIRALDCNILKGYIVSTTRNAAFDYIKKENRNRGVEESDDILETVADDTPDAIDILVRKELIECLMNSIERLSERDQSILRMKYIHDMSDEEMSRALAVKPVTVRSNLTRARQRAYKIMKEVLDNDA